MPEFYMILARKVIKIPEFLWYLPEKFTKFPNFTWFLPEKMSEFYIIIARKIFFPNFMGARAPYPPVSYAYAIVYCFAAMFCRFFCVMNFVIVTLISLSLRFMIVDVSHPDDNDDVCQILVDECTVWVKKIPPLKFSDIFPKRLGIFSPNFTRLLYVHIYTGLQIFIQLTATLTKLCHIKRDHLNVLNMSTIDRNGRWVVALNMA